MITMIPYIFRADRKTIEFTEKPLVITHATTCDTDIEQKAWGIY
ncbi:hypothetical protein [Parachlamydia sp. AcF125]|nr:hypothetical protein [Parachlamydia sp. AcF125]